MHWRLQPYVLKAIALLAASCNPMCCRCGATVEEIDAGLSLEGFTTSTGNPAALLPCRPSAAPVKRQCSTSAASVQPQCSASAALQPCSPAALHWCSPAVLIAASVQPPVVLVPTNVSRPHSYPGCTAAAPRAYAGTPWPAKNDGRVVVRALLRGGLRPASDDTRVLSYATQRGRKCESSARVVRE